jgi:DNA-binding response OmpR family regulator
MSSIQRVLIADADTALADCYRRFLAAEGYDVATAGDSSECLQRLRSFVPDILVLDPELPTDAGDDVLTVMHSADDVPTVPVVVLADGRDLEALYRAAAWPVSEWHDKPCEPPLLAASIRQSLDERAKAVARGSHRAVARH